MTLAIPLTSCAASLPGSATCKRKVKRFFNTGNQINEEATFPVRYLAMHLNLLVKKHPPRRPRPLNLSLRTKQHSVQP